MEVSIEDCLSGSNVRTPLSALLEIAWFVARSLSRYDISARSKSESLRTFSGVSTLVEVRIRNWCDNSGKRNVEPSLRGDVGVVAGKVEFSGFKVLIDEFGYARKLLFIEALIATLSVACIDFLVVVGDTSFGRAMLAE